MKIKFFTRMALCLGVILSLSSCISDDDNNYYNPPTPNVAFGIIANASPNSGDLYFFADKNQINTYALKYTNALGYGNYSIGDRVLTVQNSAGTVLATNNVTLKRGDYFTTFAVNTFDKLELVTYGDSLQYPASGNVRVRFINLSPDAAPIDIKSTSKTFATELAFKATTEFTEVPAGTYNISYTNNETSASLFTDTVTFEYGRVYTVYTKGFVTPPTGSNDTFSTETMRHL